MRFRELVETTDVGELAMRDTAFENKKSEILHCQNKLIAIDHKADAIISKIVAMKEEWPKLILNSTEYAKMPWGDRKDFQAIGPELFNQNQYFFRLGQNEYDNRLVNVMTVIHKLSQQKKFLRERIRELTVKGMTFCFTGYRDKAAEAKIISLGGEVKSSVINNLDFLVAKDPTDLTGKTKKAKEQGTRIIDATKLADMLRD